MGDGSVAASADRPTARYSRSSGASPVSPVAGVLGALAAEPEVFLVPARAGHGRQQRGPGGEPGRLLVEAPQQRPERTTGSVQLQWSPSQRRNITAETVTTAAAPIVSASDVSTSTRGSSGEPDNAGLLQGLLQGQDTNGVVGVDRGNGTENRTRHLRRRVVATSETTRQRAQARQIASSRRQPLTESSTSIATGAVSGGNSTRSGRRNRVGRQAGGRPGRSLLAGPPRARPRAGAARPTPRRPRDA
jgi:hypothetical protein